MPGPSSAASQGWTSLPTSPRQTHVGVTPHRHPHIACGATEPSCTHVSTELVLRSGVRAVGRRAKAFLANSRGTDAPDDVSTYTAASAAVAATAITVLGAGVAHAGVALRYAPRRRRGCARRSRGCARRGRGSGSRRRRGGRATRRGSGAWSTASALSALQLAATPASSAPAALPPPLTVSVVVCLGEPGRHQRCYGGAGEELKRPTAADRSLGQSAGKIVEGAVGRLLAHLLPLSPKGGILGD
jgi:hypothetical protein